MLGRFVEVKITALEHHTLRGELVMSDGVAGDR
jgi:hypothetical protein